MTTTCFDTNIFLNMVSHVKENGTSVMLHERVFSDGETTAIEVSYENFLLELVTYDADSKLIIIDQEDVIPPYFCEIRDTTLYFYAYESRIDSEEDMEIRKQNWCALVSKILKE
jgi:hypothetical protein